jgi:hypothetical protein
MIAEDELIERRTLWGQGYWEIPKGLDTSKFDFDWRPYVYDKPYIHQFGTQWQKTGGPKFVVPGNLGVKYQDCQIAIKLPDQENRCWRPMVPNATIDYSWHPDETDPPFIYVFGNQWYDAETMPTIMYRVKGAEVKKYINDIKATLLPNKDNWIIPDDIEDTFDYSWVPNPYEPPFMWQFGTQWQKTGGPKYIASESSLMKYTHIQTANRLPQPKNFRIIEQVDSTTVDYSWHPDDTEDSYNYVFGNDLFSGKDMPTMMYKTKDAIGTKYSNDLKPSLVIPKLSYTDSIFDELKQTKITDAFTIFSNIEFDYKSLMIDSDIKTLHILDNVGAIVPNHAKTYMYDRLDDYPYIKKHSLGFTNEPLDIIFISNGESNCEEHYAHLLEVTKNLPNKVIHVKDVKGRIASQHEAATMSTTPWYFLVNAKLKVDSNFDFSWQPNHMKSSRHYIFRAKNILNGLEYGHMAIVANNKKLTLVTVGTGLDFTLEKSHEVVDILSGVGVFNTSEWDAWRTAFREVLKLKYNAELIQDQDSINRLRVWTTVANGEFSQWAINGAQDAVNYYDDVNGDFPKLKLSYDWAWLRQYYDSIYP